MSFIKLSIPERILFIKDAIMVVLSDPLLKEAFADVGYTEARLEAGLQLDENAMVQWATQKDEYANRLIATGEMQKLSKEVKANFGKDRQIARITLEKSPGLFEKLGLVGEINRRRDRMILQAMYFYRGTLNEAQVAAALSGTGLTPEVLQGRLDEVNRLNEALQLQQRQKGDALAATGDRGAAMEALDEWGLKFLSIAKVIFKDDTGQLEKLGLPL